MTPQWIPIDEKIEDLKKRGLIIEDEDKCPNFFSKVTYERFTQYLNFWLTDTNDFVPGSRFAPVRDLFYAESDLSLDCWDALLDIELLLQARFTEAYGNRYGTSEALLRRRGLSFLGGKGKRRIDPAERIRNDLNKSTNRLIKQNAHAEYRDLPLGTLLSSISFGTLSILLVASQGEGGVTEDIRSSLLIGRNVFTSQVRSFVHLRNRIAHGDFLWGHRVSERPQLTHNQARKRQRELKYHDSSVYKVLGAIDHFTTNANLRKQWLDNTIGPTLEEHPLLEQGILWPETLREKIRLRPDGFE